MSSGDNGAAEIDRLLVQEQQIIDRKERPFLNVDVLYLFTPKAGFRTIKCYPHKSLTAQVQCTVVDRTYVLINEKKDRWSYLICGRVEGWIKLDDSYFGPNGPLTRVERVYRYELWPGKATFMFGGRVMLGADARMFFATNVLCIGTMALVGVGILPHLTHSFVYSLSSYTLFSFSFVNFWMTSVVEPGIIPRNSIYKTPTEPPDGARRQDSSSMRINSPVCGSPTMLGSEVVRWKICETCNHYRPPRSKHCAYCDNCVDKFDHHCPWVGQCVGKRNYKYFMYFLISTTVLVSLLTWLCGLFCAEKLYQDGVELSIPSLINVFLSTPVVVASLICLLFGFWAVFPLLTYHLYLISIGQTTNEHVRDIYQKDENVFDQGCYRNFSTALFGDVPSSLLPDFREVIPAVDYMNTIRKEREEAQI